MQNMSPEEGRAVEDRISTLKDPKNSDVPDDIKSQILGLTVLTLVGDKVLKEVAKQVRAAIPTAAAESRQRTAIGERTVVVLRALEAAAGPVRVPVLQAQTALPLGEFTETLADLQGRGLVVVHGPTGEENVSLTGVQDQTSWVPGSGPVLVSPWPANWAMSRRVRSCCTW